MKRLFFTTVLAILMGLGASSAFAWVGICGQDHTGCDNMGVFESTKFCVQHFSCNGVQGTTRCSCDPEMLQ